MGKLLGLSGRDACAILEAHGFQLVRQRGSHLVMQRTGPEGTTTTPVPNHPELRLGTLASIIRQSGLSRRLFEVGDDVVRVLTPDRQPDEVAGNVGHHVLDLLGYHGSLGSDPPPVDS